MKISVCGAHLSGMPLNHQLTDLGARLVETTRTAACYRLLALPTMPPKPAMVRTRDGASIEIEIWDLPKEHWGDFIEKIPSPLGIGTVLCENGDEVKGFIAEAIALDQGQDISRFGSWRKYIQQAMSLSD